ncbi:hypothetical protein N7536_012112 [Penicillium majusculum]|nr:hypothetical protein N7536_012112 [Penicillium majusculum]
MIFRPSLPGRHSLVYTVAETRPIQSLTNEQLEELSELTSRTQGRDYERETVHYVIAVITNEKEAMLAVNPNCYETHAHMLLEMDDELEYLNRRLSRIQTEEREDAISESELWDRIWEQSD